MKERDDQSRERVYAVGLRVLADHIALPTRGGEVVGIIGISSWAHRTTPGHTGDDVIDREGPPPDAAVLSPKPRPPFDEAPGP
jgi:hypothetical protein